jgi:hypothetical protein
VRAQALADDALAAERARVLEHHVAGLFEGGVEHEAGKRLAQELRQHGLAALQRVAPQVLAVELDQVEGGQRHHPVAAAAAQWVSTIGYRLSGQLVSMGANGIRMGEAARCFVTLLLTSLPLSIAMLVTLS